MKILLIDNKSYGILPLQKEIVALGWEYTTLETNIAGKNDIPELEEQITKMQKDEVYDCLFSFNYFVVLAKLCHKMGIPYISWVYDSPHVSLYSYTMIYDTNYVFLFDHAMYQELKNIGLKQVYYLPLASNTLGQEIGTISSNKDMDISFVGSLYSDKRNDLYSKLDGVNPYTKGYLDALIEMQKRIYGSYILRDNISQNILDEMQRVCPYEEKNSRGVESAKTIYADYFLARKVTSLERQDVLMALDKNYKVHLFSGETLDGVSNVINHGKIDYYTKMPEIFARTKINLNVTLKSIQTGIPLRVFDIMGAGSYLMTNYQAELEQYFTAGEHYDYYSEIDELIEKVDFYLKHDEAREKIAKAGHEVVKENFNYQVQLKRISEIVKL